MQLIDLSQEVEYIEINPSKVPIRFSIKLDDITYQCTIRYNSVGRFFTVYIEIPATGEKLVYGDPIRYGRPLFGTVEDERFPLPVIIPECLTGDGVSEVTYENLGSTVKLYLHERRC